LVKHRNTEHRRRGEREVETAQAREPRANPAQPRGENISEAEKRRKIENEKRRHRREKAKLRKDPAKLKLYKRWIEPEKAKAGERNRRLIEMVTFLHGAVSAGLALDLVEWWWRLNKETFKDNLKQHMKEAESHLKAVQARWLNNLSESERRALESASEKERELLKIMHELSKNRFDKTAGKSGEFFLSCRDAGARIGTPYPTAHRLLSELKRQNFISVAKAGTRGTKGRATAYRVHLDRPKKAEAGTQEQAPPALAEKAKDSKIITLPAPAPAEEEPIWKSWGLDIEEIPTFPSGKFTDRPAKALSMS